MNESMLNTVAVVVFTCAAMAAIVFITRKSPLLLLMLAPGLVLGCAIPMWVQILIFSATSYVLMAIVCRVYGGTYNWVSLLLKDE